jgi:protein-L-isoaspartate(D-aspartate) O-methyltransferase
MGLGIEMTDPHARDRELLVAKVFAAVRPRDPRVLEAFRRIPRHVFIPESQREQAYEDRALPIGEMQTISQPSMIALMLDALECTPTSRVLEVGAGSGYAAALLSCLAQEVDAIELRPLLVARARETLAGLGIANVTIWEGDGSRGLAERAPFDRILVSAAPESVPPDLVAQLSPNGRIAIPVGGENIQHLLVGKKDAAGAVAWHKDIACLFVPLVQSS